MSYRELDPRLVEMVKILDAQGKNKSQISREVGVSIRTVGRYLQKEDDPEFADELAQIRRANQEKLVTDAWKLIHKATEHAYENVTGLDARGAATVAGIYIDKVRLLEIDSSRRVDQEETITFVLKGESDRDTDRPLPDADEVPRLTGSVQGDGGGSGERENVFALPGGDEAFDGVPSHGGDDSGEFIPEPVGLRPADDPVGPVDGTGD